jgi:hypothetical protein
MFKEIEKVFEGIKSEFSVFRDIKTRQDFEKKLLVQYGDDATYMYTNHREYLDEQLKILVKAKNHGTISEEDFDVLDNEAMALLPKNIIDENKE